MRAEVETTGAENASRRVRLGVSDRCALRILTWLPRSISPKRASFRPRHYLQQDFPQGHIAPLHAGPTVPSREIRGAERESGGRAPGLERQCMPPLTAAVRAALVERWRPTWHEPPRVPSSGGSPRMRVTMEQWVADFRHAARSLRRAPGFAAVTIATLALAIGANAAIFSVVDAVLIRPLPFAHADRLMYLTAVAPGSDRR